MQRIDPGELARMKQRQFYLDMAERFRKRADEFAPIRHAESPLPVHARIAVITVHWNSDRGLYRTTDDLALSLERAMHDRPHQSKFETTNGRGSITSELIYPDQTEESYLLDLEYWSELRKQKRNGGESA